jgi:hypothetical protein
MGSPVAATRVPSKRRCRLVELEQDLDEAQDRNDLGRIEKLEAESDALSEQLMAAIGLGGRDRKLGSAAERARINVQRRLEVALDSIAQHDDELARYLTATTKTGHWCSFVPV